MNINEDIDIIHTWLTNVNESIHETLSTWKPKFISLPYSQVNKVKYESNPGKNS